MLRPLKAPIEKSGQFFYFQTPGGDLFNFQDVAVPVDKNGKRNPEEDITETPRFREKVAAYNAALVEDIIRRESEQSADGQETTR